MNSSGIQNYKSYSGYLNEKYNGKVYRVSVDAGFSCPNRGSIRTNRGCVFCDEDGSRAPYLGEESSIRLQIEKSIGFLKKRYNTDNFILYFQAFSNTYAPVEILKRIYDYALSLYPFKELIVSTRPDCINSEKAELLASYKSKNLDVWVELGLQSASDETLKKIRRGHLLEDFKKAFSLCRDRGLKITVHLIFGLPGEGISEILNTVKILAKMRPDGIKIHNINIVKGTELYKEYLKGELIVPGSKTHLEYVIKALELLPPETVIMRTTCDTVGSKLAAPKNFTDKADFLRILNAEMERKHIRQGMYFK